MSSRDRLLCRFTPDVHRCSSRRPAIGVCLMQRTDSRTWRPRTAQAFLQEIAGPDVGMHGVQAACGSLCRTERDGKVLYTMLHVDVTPGAIDFASTLGRCKHRLPNNTRGCYRAGHLGLSCCIHRDSCTNSLAEEALQTSFHQHNDCAHPVATLATAPASQLRHGTPHSKCRYTDRMHSQSNCRLRAK
jgi:hypothetical protein